MLYRHVWVRVQCALYDIDEDAPAAAPPPSLSRFVEPQGNTRAWKTVLLGTIRLSGLLSNGKIVYKKKDKLRVNMSTMRKQYRYCSGLTQR